MADEITHKVRLQLANSTLKMDFNPGQIKIDQSTQVVSDNVYSIGTSEETVTYAEISTPGVCIAYNLDATNYVQIGRATSAYFGRLRPASIPSVFELDPGVTTLYLKANTAACLVRVIVLDA